MVTTGGELSAVESTSRKADALLKQDTNGQVRIVRLKARAGKPTRLNMEQCSYSTEIVRLKARAGKPTRVSILPTQWSGGAVESTSRKADAHAVVTSRP